MIKLVNQINDKSCVHACVAMLSGKRVEDLWERFPFPLEPKHELTLLIESKLWPVAQPQFSNQFPLCGVYLVTVPSMNVEGMLHRVVVVLTETEAICYDPQAGREGKKFYAKDCFNPGSPSPVFSYGEVCMIDFDMLSELSISQ